MKLWFGKNCICRHRCRVSSPRDCLCHQQIRHQSIPFCGRIASIIVPPGFIDATGMLSHGCGIPWIFSVRIRESGKNEFQEWLFSRSGKSVRIRESGIKEFSVVVSGLETVGRGTILAGACLEYWCWRVSRPESVVRKEIGKIYICWYNQNKKNM